MRINKKDLFFICFLILLTVCQLLIDYEYESIISTFICFFCSMVSFFYLKKAWEKGYVFSSIPILGALIGTQLGPLFFQTINMGSVNFNLRMSYITFLNTGLFLLSLIVGHFLYINSNKMNLLKNTLTLSFKKISLFEDIPGKLVIVLTGLAFFSVYYGSVNEVDIGNVGGKFLAIFSVFTMLPLAYFVQGIQNGDKSKKWYFTITILYFIALIILGVLKNSRGIFANFSLCMLLMLCYFLYINKIKITKKISLFGVFLIIPLLYVFKILTAMSGAIILARGSRDELNGMEFLNLSFEYLKGILSEEIREYGVNANVVENLDSYNEFYLNNDFISRLLTIKFNDNIFYYSSLLDVSQYGKINQYFIDKTIALLPQPIINIFTDDFEKKYYTDYSYGDWIYYSLAGGELGGFKLGSITGSGLNLFGYLFFPIVIFTTPFLYAFFDSFVLRSKELNGRNYITNFSIISILFIFTMFSIPNSDSIFVIIGLLLRGLMQTILIYLIMFLLYKLFIKLISLK